MTRVARLRDQAPTPRSAFCFSSVCTKCCTHPLMTLELRLDTRRAGRLAPYDCCTMPTSWHRLGLGLSADADARTGMSRKT